MDKDYYNPNFKNEFLSGYNNNTKHTYSSLFIHSRVVEFVLEKDIFELELKYLSKIFQIIDPTTINNARSFGSVMNTYINWAIEKGYKKDANPLEGLGYDWFDRFVDPNSKIYISDKDLIELEDKLINAQDSVILRLLFEGVRGKDFSEILNIKREDIDFKNSTLKLIDDETGERTLEVSDRCMTLIKKALSEEKYWNKNGETQNEKRLYSLLIESDYLIKTSKTQTQGEGRAEKHLIYRRLANIQEITRYKMFNPNSIRNSGMIYIAAQSYFKDKEVTKEVLKEIAEKFMVKKVNNHGYMVYNYALMRRFINEEEISLLYKED